MPKLADALHRVGADALAVHTNPCRRPCRTTATPTSPARSSACTAWWPNPYPVLVKEVGHGIGGGGAQRLRGIPLAAVDVAGAGGTSWARVEQLVRYGEVRYPAIAEWVCRPRRPLQEVRRTLPAMPLVASGGIRSGMDAAKAIAMGASVVALARPLLAPAIESSGAVLDVLAGFIEELRVCLHGAGAENLAELRKAGSSWSRAGTARSFRLSEKF